MSYRVVFLGTPTIAASCLQALIDKHINVVGVVTRPDKPQGRNKQIMFSAVKQLALKHHIPILQPNKMIENYDELAR
jgi:methionyl-tRNA formyltransferase